MKNAAGGSRSVQFVARRRGPKWLVTLMVPVNYTLDDAAKAMALVHPEPPRRLGRKTCYFTLQDAARQRLQGRRLNGADPEMVAMYREKLLEFGIFPPEAAGAAEDAAG